MSNSNTSVSGLGGGVRKSKTPQEIAAEIRLQHINAQVDQVVEKMRVNANDVLERDEKISVLLERADALEDGASQFGQNARALKRKGCMKNAKVIIVVVGIVGFLCILVIGSQLGLLQ